MLYAKNLSHDISACSLSPAVRLLSARRRTENIKLKSNRSFVGTGGTISGVGQFLKSVKGDVKIVLADPEGSGLYNKVGLCTTVIKFVDPLVRTPVLSLAPCGSGFLRFSNSWLRGSNGLQAPDPSRAVRPVRSHLISDSVVFRLPDPKSTPVLLFISYL